MTSISFMFRSVRWMWGMTDRQMNTEKLVGISPRRTHCFTT